MNKIRLLIYLTALIVVQGAFGQATFHGDNARTGVYSSPGPKQFGGVKWQFKTDGMILSSPAISGGTVYIGSADTFFYAVDQKTGQQKWKFETQGPIASSAAIENGIVYFSSFDGNFYALDAASGAVKWKFAVELERRFAAKHIHGNNPKDQLIPDAWDFFASSPAVSNGLVYFGSGDGNVYALDAVSGAVKWKFKTGDVVHSSPAVVNNTVYIGSFDSNLYALDADTGKEKWRFEAGRDPDVHNQEGFTSSPAVADGTVYIGCRDAHVYAIDAQTGKKKWDYYTDKGWVSNTPAVRDGVVYAGSGSSLQFIAIDAQTGKARFTYDMRTGVFSSPAIAGDLAYIGNANGKFHAIDLKTGNLVWEFQTDSSKQDLLKVLNPNGSFNGKTLGKRFFSDFEDMYIFMYRRLSVGSIMSSPVINQGEVYFSSTDGFLYALK